MDDLYWDPLDAASHLDPYETWKRLRDEAPVYRNEDRGFYALSRFADVEPAHRDTSTFISGHGTVLEIMRDEPIPSNQLMFLDPPAHTRLRGLVSRAFTPRRIDHLEDRIRDICDDLFDALADREEFDYVQEFAALLPSRVISELLGVPDADREMLRREIDLIFHVEPGVGMINDVSFTASLKINSYIRAQLRECRSNPRDDMFTDLSRAEITDEQGTRRLTIEEGADFGNLLIAAGTETVARLLGWSAVILDAHPTQRRELMDDVSLVPNAVEELLRFEAPSPVTGRYTTRDLDLHGTRVPAGSKVLLISGAANRDERQFPNGDSFDIHRTFDLHLSLGHGPHFCIGAALARMEARIALEETLRRYPDLRVDADATVRATTSTVRGYEKIGVVTGERH